MMLRRRLTYYSTIFRRHRQNCYHYSASFSSQQWKTLPRHRHIPVILSMRGVTCKWNRCFTSKDNNNDNGEHPKKKALFSVTTTDEDTPNTKKEQNHIHKKEDVAVVKKELESSNEESKSGDIATTNTLSTLAPSDAAPTVYIPVRLQAGDDAPRYPNLTALPVISRPLFPGILSSVTLTDPTTINALVQLNTKFIGVFLRKSSSTEVSDGGIIHDQPEIITQASDLHSVGSFVQIHRVTRGTLGEISSGSAGNGSLQMHNPTTGNGSGDTTIFVNGGKDHEDHDLELTDDDTSSSINQKNLVASVLLLAHRRIDLQSVNNIGPPINVTVSHWDRAKYTPSGNPDQDNIVTAMSNEILNMLREVAQLNPLFRENLSLFPPRLDASNPYRLADFCASVTTGSAQELQAVLEERDAERRLHKALVLLSKERELSKLQQEIQKKVEDTMTESQRKYFLTEQLKSIKKELGMEKDDKDALITKYRTKIAEWNADALTSEVAETIDSELEKMSTLEKNSLEFNMTRSYLDWLTSVPWGILSKENFDIREARRILNQEHYGMDEVKDVILQFIAVGKLRGMVHGQILCLVGPPGTGKTSIANSVADALGRKFYRFSVGGLTDVSEIKGHRRTYVGAMPGKIIQCVKSAGTINPLVLIDEIDKIGMSFRGDPASALLEVLDPSQNSNFRDYFLDVPVDISKILFMCTANNIENIPGPLLDRMEVILLSGYDMPEKAAIATQYLVPKAMQESGLMVKAEIAVKNTDENKPGNTYMLGKNIPESLSLDGSAIDSLIRWYCREAGVRNLNKHIEKITRKLALQIVAEGEGTELTDKSARKSDTWTVTETNLHEYVGRPIFTKDRLYEHGPLPNGIVMGLAWTAMGGSALYVETQEIVTRGLDNKGKSKVSGVLKVTGQLGKVMEESSQIAYTVARAKLSDILPSSSFFDDVDVHMHVPEGATPKDGPSAGVTMTTSLLSLALGKPIKNDLAMTGEISLTGKVLPVGGIKEKTMAARRARIKCIVLPLANRHDFDEMPNYLKENIKFHFADDYSTVFDVAFGGKL